MKMKALKRFYESVGNLTRLNIIRSSKYLGDIGEHLVSMKFGVKLTPNQRTRGFDGTLSKAKVQIKSHDGSIGTNISIGDPKYFDVLFIVIGPMSRLRSKEHKRETFRIYKFEKNELKRWNNGKSEKYYCSKRRIEKKEESERKKRGSGCIKEVSFAGRSAA